MASSPSKSAWDRLWLAVLRYAYRRLRLTDSKLPVGLPTIRDPDSRCEFYEPRPVRLFSVPWFDDCVGDGHYLCGECRHFDAEGRANG